MKTDKIKLIRRVILMLNNSLSTLTASIHNCVTKKYSGEAVCDFDDITFAYSIRYADKNIVWLV